MKLIKSLFVSLLFIGLLVSCGKKGSSNKDKGVVSNVNPIESQDYLYKQDFESFGSTSPILVDFSLNNPSKGDYVKDGTILFKLDWTSSTRNLLADIYGYDRSEMTSAQANSLCSPKLEVGPEKYYVSGTSTNTVSELDSSLSHCGQSEYSPAALKLSSYIPTRPGYIYKVNFSYLMRPFEGMTEKSHREFLAYFGNSKSLLPVITSEFTESSLEVISINTYSLLSFIDRGTPDGYGVLLDDIYITEVGKAPLYDDCEALFSLNSTGFKKCVQGQVDISQSCHFDTADSVAITYKEGLGVSSNRKDTSKLFSQENAVSGKVNFLSLGLKGSVSLSCLLDGHKALYDLFGKRLHLSEITWGSSNYSNFPEKGIVQVRLEKCLDENLNKTTSIGSIITKGVFDYVFETTESGLSYEGCKLVSLSVRDVTSTGPSKDGIDLNSFELK